MGRIDRADPRIRRNGIRLDAWNLYLFIVGVIGWFIVGTLWNDRAIMLIHLVALGSMMVGMASQ